jgi:2-polyprenyl-6-methoxyphenol hydroxylase-like FAD-dependent oxidoreductase
MQILASGGGMGGLTAPLALHARGHDLNLLEAALHRIDRCWLPGARADALHALSCAPGFNIRWLMRALQAKARKALSWSLQMVASGGEQTLGGLRTKLNVLAFVLRTAPGQLPLDLVGAHVEPTAG